MHVMFFETPLKTESKPLVVEHHPETMDLEQFLSDIRVSCLSAAKTVFTVVPSGRPAITSYNGDNAVRAVLELPSCTIKVAY